MQQLSSQALQTHAAIDTLKKERGAIEELRVKLHESEQEVKQATSQAGTLKGELDQIRASATSLTQDYAKIRETSREAREDTTAALSSVKEIQKKLEPLTQLHELSQSTADRLASLNALSEHVTRKAKALESQQQAVEHAVVQANRVSEMVWSMDAQMAKLHEGLKQSAKAEETIGADREAVGRHHAAHGRRRRSSMTTSSAKPRSSRRIQACCSKPSAPKSARWRSGSASSRRSTSG